MINLAITFSLIVFLLLTVTIYFVCHMMDSDLGIFFKKISIFNFIGGIILLVLALIRIL